MAESSRSRVTITLGRTGQVVKRAGTVFDSGFSESQPAIGGKRSVRDRLGAGGDACPLNNKRQREENDRLTANGANDSHSHLGKNDLRFKLLQKNVIKEVQSNSQRNGVDLRQTLSRAVQDYKSDLSMRQQISEPMDSRPVLPQRRKDPSAAHIPPTRSANVLLTMEPPRNPHSPWTLERLREHSPDRVLTTSRTLSQLRSDEEVIKRPLVRPYDDTRTVSYTTRDLSEPRRPLGTALYMTKPTMTIASSVNPGVPPISRPPPPRGAEPKSSYRVDERLSLDSFLYSLGLEKYIIPFKAEEVDMSTLRQMGERDLKELGIPMGPRKKILLALMPRSKIPL